MIHPDGGVVSVPGGGATFECSHNSRTLTGVQWLLNGTRLQDLNVRNVTAVFSDILETGYLEFTNLPLEYNTTEISCMASVNSRMSLSSDSVLLRIQGIAMLY